ncbi:MAG: HD domain-containing protein [Porcipelethomonas sp.]
MEKLERLFLEMTEYYKGDPKRIQHFVKVHSFARLIGIGEEFDENQLFILETAAYVHDIGIRTAEEKFGSCSGKLQEQEGPCEAEKMLMRLEFPEEVIKRVCFLVGHHHTYSDIEGGDYRALVEADFLVNLYEDNASAESVKSALDRIFKTKTGIKLCRMMFGL